MAKNRSQSLSERYARRLRAVAGESGVESTGDPAEVDLSGGGIAARIDRADADLRRIIKEYLGDKPELHEIADQIKVGGGAALRMVADRDDEALANNPTALAQLETIVHVDGSRPSFLVKNDCIDRASSPIGTWGATLDASQDTLHDAFSCVGRIDSPNSVQGFEGTGYLVGDNLILTNRHVLQEIAARDAEGVWRINPGVQIDFGHEFRGRASVGARKLQSVAFCGAEPILSGQSVDHTKLDLAAIELEPATDANRPRFKLSVDLSPDWPNPQLTVFIVGYPGSPRYGVYAPTLLEQLFNSTFGHKRIAPGLVIQAQAAIEPWTVAHDATSMGGNSGSVVLVAGREMTAAGLHYGGRMAEPRENWAHILGLAVDRRGASSTKTLAEVLKGHEVVLIDALGGPTG